MQRDESTAGERDDSGQQRYQRRMLEVRGAFETGATGGATIAARAQAMDDLVIGLWKRASQQDSKLGHGIALLAIGGYGRRELFPHSDVDLLFLLEAKTQERDVKESIRRIGQQMWDAGIRVSLTTRKLAECERFSQDNAEFTISLLDHRFLVGDVDIDSRLSKETIPKLLRRDQKAIVGRLLDLTRQRHGKYGDTLFHLEPNVKDCPGGLRDTHVCRWLKMLEDVTNPDTEDVEFRQAVEFLTLVRCFLHYRHERDDNVLDWQAQDAAADAAVGLNNRDTHKLDAAYWMRFYFRHARSVERRLKHGIDGLSVERGPRHSLLKRERGLEPQAGFRLDRGRIILDPAMAEGRVLGERRDPAHDPDVVLRIFATIARIGCRLGPEAEDRISQALPLLSANFEEGPTLWRRFEEVLLGDFAGNALRVMHALGILELLIPEFHGIDALVIRDAYHRYTVDEHTFVLIDTLHGLSRIPAGDAAPPPAIWASRFGAVLRELPHPSLLYLMALLHDTGKGRDTGDHAKESVRLAQSVLDRLELEPYETDLVISLIANHLEMASTLRRDIFDAETVRAFAGKVQTPEMLRMLTLFTYADINAVHPDALTPWKAENLWRLYIATANYLDRSVDEERVGAREARELVDRVASLIPNQRTAVAAFLEGFPERYVLTRSPEQIRTHFSMAERLEDDRVQLHFRHSPTVSELTVVTPDRALLFANMTGALAAWGMNIVTADAFSNRAGVVVDSFRFTDPFRTLELNASEHERFIRSLHDVMAGTVEVEKLLSGRRRGRRKTPKIVVETKVEFNDVASSHSTLVEVITQDAPGLLRALSLAIAAQGNNIEVALIDTEGEAAIDVFYLTHNGAKLEKRQQRALKAAMLEAMEKNAQ